MTPEQQSALEAIESKLAGQDHNLQELSDEDFATCVSLLMPQPSFTPEQRGFISRWFLEGDEDDELDIINLSPSGSIYPPRLLDDRRLWSIDLLSDVINGGRLSALLPVLSNMLIVQVLEEEWPIIELEDQ